MLIVEFLLGVLAGTASGLIIVKRSGSRIPAMKASGTTRNAPSKSRVASKQTTKQRKTKHRGLHRGQTRHVPRPSNTVADNSQKSLPQTVVLSCPACGLEAPESLMNEHFLGSPSHKDQPAQAMPVVASPSAKPEAISSEEDSRDSLRSLLQMLVPPRAFGRRHGQRSIDPLASIVQSMDGSPVR